MKTVPPCSHHLLVQLQNFYSYSSWSMSGHSATEAASSNGSLLSAITHISSKKCPILVQSGMSFLAEPPFCCVSLPVSGTFFTHRRAPPLWLRCQREVFVFVKLPLFPASPLSLLLSDLQSRSPVFSSAASSKCLQITQLWNSTLQLFFFMFIRTKLCLPWFLSVVGGSF